MAYFKSDMDGLAKERQFLDDNMKRAPYPRITLEIGTTVVRVLPAYDETGRWYYRYGMHFNLPIEHPRKTWPCCGATDMPETCMFCESADDYRNRAPELYSSFKRKTRTLFNAYVVGKEDEGCKVLEVGPSISRDIILIAERESDPTDPENGFAFVIEKRSTGPNPRDIEYMVSAQRENTPIAEAAWPTLDNLHPLAELVEFPTYEEQVEILDGSAQAQVPADAQLPPAPEPRQISGRSEAPATREQTPAEREPASAPAPAPVEAAATVEDTRVRLRERLRASRG